MDDLVERLKALSEQATPGPWEQFLDQVWMSDADNEEEDRTQVCDCYSEQADAALIVALRNEALPLITQLTAERDAALAHAERLAGAVSHFTQHYLLDERQDVRNCWDETHHTAVVALFDALASWQERG